MLITTVSPTISPRPNKSRKVRATVIECSLLARRASLLSDGPSGLTPSGRRGQSVCGAIATRQPTGAVERTGRRASPVFAKKTPVIGGVCVRRGARKRQATLSNNDCFGRPAIYGRLRVFACCNRPQYFVLFARSERSPRENRGRCLRRGNALQMLRAAAAVGGRVASHHTPGGVRELCSSLEFTEEARRFWRLFLSCERSSCADSADFGACGKGLQQKQCNTKEIMAENAADPSIEFARHLLTRGRPQIVTVDWESQRNCRCNDIKGSVSRGGPLRFELWSSFFMPESIQSRGTAPWDPNKRWREPASRTVHDRTQRNVKEMRGRSQPIKPLASDGQNGTFTLGFDRNFWCSGNFPSCTTQRFVGPTVVSPMPQKKKQHTWQRLTRPLLDFKFSGGVLVPEIA